MFPLSSPLGFEFDSCCILSYVHCGVLFLQGNRVRESEKKVYSTVCGS